MKRYVQVILFAAHVLGASSEGLAQKRQATKPPVSLVHIEWRTPIPRSVVHGELEGAQMIAVEMLNHNIGWAIGHASKFTNLFRTGDGGKTWERQTMFDGAGAGLYDIGFADANNGWIVGTDHILRTTDGGESWTPVDLGLKGLRFDAKELLVLGPDAIVIGTDLQNMQIMLTVDGGATWTRVGLVKDGGGGAGSEHTVTGLALSEASSIFATTGSHPYSRGRIHRSDDRGHSWEVVAEAEKPLHGIAFRGKRGVAVGEGLAFFTEDGGDTWRRVVMPGRRYAVDFADETSVVAVGRDPSVVVSWNGGKTWEPGPSPIIESGSLVDIQVVDPGWWFVVGTHALYHFIDHIHIEPLASGRLPIPVDVKLPGGRALPRGLYDVMLGHQGDEHVLRLDRRGDVPAGAPLSPGSGTDASQEGAAQLETAVSQQETQQPPACAQPCGATLPAEVTYDKEEMAGAKDMKSFFRISLEPTASGIAVVGRTAVTPPRNIALALAAVGASQNSEGEVRQVATKAGGLFGRIRKAAAGDVRGAAAGSGVNPQATQQRLRAAKAAPPAVYKVTLRYPLDLFSGKKK